MKMTGKYVNCKLLAYLGPNSRRCKRLICERGQDHRIECRRTCARREGTAALAGAYQLTRQFQPPMSTDGDDQVCPQRPIVVPQLIANQAKRELEAADLLGQSPGAVGERLVDDRRAV